MLFAKSFEIPRVEQECMPDHENVSFASVLILGQDIRATHLTEAKGRQVAVD